MVGTVHRRGRGSCLGGGGGGLFGSEGRQSANDEQVTKTCYASTSIDPRFIHKEETFRARSAKETVLATTLSISNPK